MDGPSRRETIAVLLGIATGVVGNIFFQSLFLVFPPTQCQWALLVVVSGSLLVLVLLAVLPLLIVKPAR